MQLSTPDTIHQMLAEKPLELIAPEALDQASRTWQNNRVNQVANDDLRHMPVVSIGQPETWALKDLYSPGDIPRPISTKLDQADFYLARFSCSFRPLRAENCVEWARFRVTLLPHTSPNEQPIAFDVYPQQVIEKASRPVNVTLSPTLKFQEVELTVGSAQFNFDFSEQIPLIMASLGTSRDPSWDYGARAGQDVRGIKWMYLLIKAPKGQPSGRALLDLEADILVHGVRLPVTFWRRQDQAAEHMTASLWSERT